MRALAVIAAMSWPAIAFADGRSPITNRIQFSPHDPHAIYVSTTFGLLVSRDDGCSFRWICEDNIGYGSTFDPKYRIGRDGAIFATTFNGLRVSRDGGCSFTTATAERPASDPGRIADRWIAALDIGPTGDVWIATADDGKPNNVYRSTDNGASFEPRGMLSQSIWWRSVAVAPSRASRIYATGYQVAGAAPGGGAAPPATHFARSDDAGTHWTASTLADVKIAGTPLVFVVGVDPVDPDIVLMLSSRAQPPSGDILYRSIDGGATWREVLAPAAPIIDVSIMPGGALATTRGAGAFRSLDRGASFARLDGAPQLACLTARGDGALYGCAANWEPDFKAIARSAGAAGGNAPSGIDAATWDKVFRFAELAGPLDCPIGTPEQRSCGGKWPALQQRFGATGPTTCAPPPDTRPPVQRSGGCCDAHRGEFSAPVGLAALCGVAIRRRRRR